jgi:hypothetical protein
LKEYKYGLVRARARKWTRRTQGVKKTLGGKILPASFEDAGNQAFVGHFPEAKTGKFELAEKAAGTASQLAPIS